MTNARSIANKIEELHLLMQTHKPYVLCVTETWLTEDMPDSLFCPSDYSVVRLIDPPKEEVLHYSYITHLIIVLSLSLQSLLTLNGLC